jgi:hypothetical protein
VLYCIDLFVYVVYFMIGVFSPACAASNRGVSLLRNNVLGYT